MRITPATDRILCRMELDGVTANPSATARAIHDLLGRTTGAVPINAIALALDIAEIRVHPLDGFEAALVTDQERSCGAVLLNARSTPQRQRYSLAHELYHFLNPLHQTIGGRFTCSKGDMAASGRSNDIQSDIHLRQEWEANRFAIELLAPVSRFAACVRRIPDMEHIVSLAGELDLSRQATARRYVELQSTSCAVVFAKDGQVHYIDRNPEFPFVTLKRGDPLPPCPMPTQGNISDHDDVDACDWIGRSAPISLVAQTLKQDQGWQMVLLAVEA